MDNRTVANLKKYGFAKGAGNILMPHEVLELKKFINELFEDESIHIETSSNDSSILTILGRNPRIDQLLEKIICHEDVQFVLSQVLGCDFKIWEVLVRRSDPGNTGIGLHQDALGQTNLVFSLSDNLSGSGATAFFSKSHILPRWVVSRISWYPMWIASYLLTPLKLECGDSAIFFNRTWHARLVNNTSQFHDVIMIGIFPQGGLYGPPKWIQDRLERWQGSPLHRLLDASVGTRVMEDGRFQVISQQNNQINESYAMSLESGKCEYRDWDQMLLYFKLIFLELVFFPLRLMYRLLRALLRPLIHLARAKI
ncbi:MAG TPA: putative 2OG-Fe(II) oxygenase [Candidatus Marinimicrobia bacterium]|nr:putative 2OG-Fe(II) oxygenase [Nitrospirales bacterium]HIA13566.1 putative 2OG-Fe(II) oxygenase [Nitrospirales bacterium]HIC05024.1 putative 2OG-Fe(II) oxygenase [Nitrospirales bacterium]HIO56645.1 putative 2OG-Fe(II) oxygenase [Candidatus Neomarinimicrobiota bacterium]